MLRIERAEPTPALWADRATYADRLIFHTPAWLRFVAEAQRAEPVLATIADGAWSVPSQSGSGSYRVTINPDSCACDDFQLTQKPCKHVHAARLLQCDHRVLAPAQESPPLGLQRLDVCGQKAHLLPGTLETAQQGRWEGRAVPLVDLVKLGIHIALQGELHAMTC